MLQFFNKCGGAENESLVPLRRGFIPFIHSSSGGDAASGRVSFLGSDAVLELIAKSSASPYGSEK